MPSDCISFRDTNYFSALICDYLDEKPELQSFYNRFPNLENFEAQINQKQKTLSSASRTILSTSLKEQYKHCVTSELTLQNIEFLKNENTFTITTGHQLNLFTGPLYFLYKIISAINLAKELKQKYSEYDFVPVYWMATEDHDFDEINYFNFKGKKVQWSREASGGVGRLDTKGLDEVLDVFASEIGTTTNAQTLIKLFNKAYLDHDNLADATRYLANQLFGDYGLIIIDADTSELKQLFIPYVEKELLKNTSFKSVSESNQRLDNLDAKYKIQVNPREINLFYLKDGLRERIVKNEESYFANETKISWNEKDILKEVNDYPERFSPNVIMRPLYQEVILPNLCYIGGGGELAYWLQLKDYFETVDVVFPILLLRNSVLIRTEKQSEKLKKLEVSVDDLFLNQSEFKTMQTKRISSIDISFSKQKTHLKEQFEALYKLAEQTDKSFLGAVGAQEKKQIKGLEHLEKRLLKAQKSKLNDQLERILTIQDELFPGQSLQERNTNFAEFYLEYGTDLIPKLIGQLQPLKGNFSIVEF